MRSRPLAAAALLVLLTACGGTDALPPRSAAEPGEAPVREGDVPGRLLPLDGEPEGIVVSAEGIAVVALRGPDALALVDLDTGEEVRRVTTPSAARHLSLAAPDGPVLVPLEGTDELLLLDPATGEVVERLDDLPRNPHDAARHPDGTVSVTDEFGGGMYFVRPGGEVVRLDSTRQPGGVAAVGDLAVMVDVVGEGVRVYDVREPAEVASADLGEGLTHLVALGDDRVAIADTDGDRLIVAVVRPRLEDVVELTVEGRPYGLAVDEQRQRLYVTRTEDNELLVFDTTTLTAGAEPLAVLPTVAQANTLAVDRRTGAVVVAGRAQGVLQVLSPDDLDGT